jgi:hypothetical protein
LLEELTKLEFVLNGFIAARGSNRDFLEMDKESQEHWLLFIQAIEEQRQFYESWLMEHHLARDPNAERLSELPSPVRQKIQAVKTLYEKLKREREAKQL